MARRKADPSTGILDRHAVACEGARPSVLSLVERLVAEQKFDAWIEGLRRRFYSEEGRPGIPPGIYFRMLLIGYFENLDSERGIAWRCQDSLSLRDFLGCTLDKDTPDHSSLSRIRQRIDLETHQEVFAFVLKILAQHDLVEHAVDMDTGAILGVTLRTDLCALLRNRSDAADAFARS